MNNVFAYLLVWWKKWEGIFSDCLSFIYLLNIFYHFLLIYQLIYLLPYLRVSFSVVKANTEEMEKALHLLFKTFLFFVFVFCSKNYILRWKQCSKEQKYKPFCICDSGKKWSIKPSLQD